MNWQWVQPLWQWLLRSGQELPKQREDQAAFREAVADRTLGELPDMVQGLTIIGCSGRN